MIRFPIHPRWGCLWGVFNTSLQQVKLQNAIHFIALHYGATLNVPRFTLIRNGVSLNLIRFALIRCGGHLNLIRFALIRCGGHLNLIRFPIHSRWGCLWGIFNTPLQEVKLKNVIHFGTLCDGAILNLIRFALIRCGEHLNLIHFPIHPRRGCLWGVFNTPLQQVKLQNAPRFTHIRNEVPLNLIRFTLIRCGGYLNLIHIPIHPRWGCLWGVFNTPLQ